MGKFVYLFELDSVRNDKASIQRGIEAMCNEIITHGNTVVLTYNQFIDNVGFLQLLQDKEAFKNLITLFENDAIKISQFGELRNISYYLLNSLEKAYVSNNEADFAYSALPLDSSQKRLIALVKRSIQHSDLTEIESYQRIDNNEDRKRLANLFIERHHDQIKNTTYDEDEMIQILNQLQSVLALIFNLSKFEYIYQPPKEPKEYSSLKLTDYIDFIIKNANVEAEVKKLLDATNTSNNRSDILRNIDEMEMPAEISDRAKLVVDLAYNYTSEISILNTSKHYNLVNNGKGLEIDKASFCEDFDRRLEQIEPDYRSLEPANISDDPNKNTIKLLKQAVRISTYNIKDNNSDEAPELTPTYESALNDQVKSQRRKVWKNTLKKLAALLGIFLFVIVFEIATDLFHSLVTLDFESVTDIDSIIDTSWKTILFLFTGEIFSQILSRIKFFKWMIPLSEIAINLYGVAKDLKIIIRKSNKSYINEYTINKQPTEPSGNSKTIKFVTPKPLKLYKNYIKNNESRFNETINYPIANVNDPNTAETITENIINNEEIYGRTYGVTHASEYTTMVVDPIINLSKTNDSFYPYERSIPEEGREGIVAVLKYNRKFILLDQERHAIRGQQKCFIRGFGENINDEDNAKNEICEELGIETEDINNVKHLGTITPDSGASANKTEIYYAEVSKYNIKKGYEGIINCTTVSKRELEKMIAQNQIQDSFTICAYTLYKSKINH